MNMSNQNEHAWIYDDGIFNSVINYNPCPPVVWFKILRRPSTETSNWRHFSDGSSVMMCGLGWLCFASAKWLHWIKHTRVQLILNQHSTLIYTIRLVEWLRHLSKCLLTVSNGWCWFFHMWFNQNYIFDTGCNQTCQGPGKPQHSLCRNFSSWWQPLCSLLTYIVWGGSSQKAATSH